MFFQLTLSSAQETPTEEGRGHNDSKLWRCFTYSPFKDILTRSVRARGRGEARSCRRVGQVTMQMRVAC
jgi:hypothetical protein